MKKVISILLVIILCSACGKKEVTKEIELCNKIDPFIEKYNNDEMKYSDLVKKLDKLYDNYCSKVNATCNNIRTMKSYPEEINKEIKLALINEITRSCSLAREK